VLSDDVFDKISEEKAPQGVITVAKYIDKIEKNATIYNSNNFSVDIGEQILLLESVRDPSNLGAIIRSAAAFGVDHLIVSEDCADIYNAKTVRASMGTLFSQRISRVASIPDALQALRTAGRRTFAAALDRDAKRLGSFAVRQGDCVVIGNEGHGLSEQTIAACDTSVFIPITERAESLNAAVAASVLMWAFGVPTV
jgi:TrmH family RNA methyltransferase